jgi:hypothetical protein
MVTSPSGTTSAGAGATTGGGSADSTGGGSGAQIAIDVEFILVTPDQLRKIEFGLTKTIQGTDVLWTITFELFERTSTSGSFATDPDISLTVKIDPTLNDSANQASKGLTPVQTAQATGPAALAVKHSDVLPQAVVNNEVQKVIQ